MLKLLRVSYNILKTFCDSGHLQIAILQAVANLTNMLHSSQWFTSRFVNKAYVPPWKPFCAPLEAILCPPGSHFVPPWKPFCAPLEAILCPPGSHFLPPWKPFCAPLEAILCPPGSHFVPPWKPFCAPPPPKPFCAQGKLSLILVV